MRIAFYAPMKAPTHPVPSGDRRVARLLMAALEAAGHDVRLACRLRSWDDAARPGRQARLAQLAARLRPRLLQRLSRWQPQLWFTYHLYHKAPDLLGQELAAALRIPYVVAEASHANKQADGPWALGCQAAAQAIGCAKLVLTLNQCDAAGIRPLLAPEARLVDLPPFIDRTPFVAAAAARDRHRADLAFRLGLPSGEPWLLAVGMMRGGDKQKSYRLLARSLEGVGGQPWQLLIVGDGSRRACVEASFQRIDSARLRWLGAVDGDAMPGIYAAADLLVWPAVNEAYGMALLEAQASGCPVIAGRFGGVAEIVADGVSGVLTPPGDSEVMATCIAALLTDENRRLVMSEAAMRYAADHHDFHQASRTLDRLLRSMVDIL